MLGWILVRQRWVFLLPQWVSLRASLSSGGKCYRRWGICDFGVLGDFVSVDEEASVIFLYVSNPLKNLSNLIWHALATFEFSGTLMRCRYYCAFPVSGRMSALNLPSCNVRLPMTWLMTAQSYPSGHTRGASLLGLEGGVLIVTIWFAVSYFPWRHNALDLPLV